MFFDVFIGGLVCYNEISMKPPKPIYKHCEGKAQDGQDHRNWIFS